MRCCRPPRITACSPEDSPGLARPIAKQLVLLLAGAAAAAAPGHEWARRRAAAAADVRRPAALWRAGPRDQRRPRQRPRPPWRSWRCPLGELQPLRLHARELTVICGPVCWYSIMICSWYLPVPAQVQGGLLPVVQEASNPTPLLSRRPRRCSSSSRRTPRSSASWRCSASSQVRVPACSHGAMMWLTCLGCMAHVLSWRTLFTKHSCAWPWSESRSQ
jgi:hypothetical protein